MLLRWSSRICLCSGGSIANALPTTLRSGSVSSPAPIFNTDEQTYVLVTLPVHVLAGDQADVQVSDQAGNQVKDLIFNTLNDIVAFGNQASDQANAILNDAIHTRVRELLGIVTQWIKRAELFAKMDLSNHSTNRTKYLDPLIDLGWIEMEYPESPTHPNQTYKITAAGNRILKLISPE